jgi:hypothetical protein
MGNYFVFPDTGERKNKSLLLYKFFKIIAHNKVVPPHLLRTDKESGEFPRIRGD